MKEYIDKINTIDELLNAKKNFNALVENKINEIHHKQIAESLSKLSFGLIKENFETLSPMLIETKEGKKILNKYINTIKENTNLLTLHNIYEGIRKIGNNSDLDNFFSLLKEEKDKIDVKTLNKDIKKLGDILSEAYLPLNDVDNLLITENNTVNEAIDYIVRNDNTLKNASEYGYALKVLKEDIQKREHEVSLSESKNIDETANALIENFNKKYDSLSDEEKEIIREFITSENREEIYKKYMTECIEKLNLRINEFEKDNDFDSVSRMEKIKEQLSNKKYSEETLTEDLNNICEMTKLFE